MKAILLLLLIAILGVVHSEEMAKGAGIAVHIRQEFFDNLKDNIIKEFIETLETGHLDDINFSKDLTAFKVLLSMTNITIHDFQMDLGESYLVLNDTAPYLQLYFSNISMVSLFDFDFRTDPTFIDDHGKGYFNLEPTSLYLGYDIQTMNGRPTFVTQSAEINCTDITLVLDGSADFSKVIFQLSALLKEFIKTKINDYFLSIVGATVTPIINGSIANIYRTVYEFREDIIANFTSTLNPAFTKDAMTVFFKGEVRPKDEEVLPFHDQLQVPADAHQYGRQLQIAVSDYILNSTLYSLYKKEYLKIDTQDVAGEQYGFPASYLFYVFPTLAEKYTGDENIWINAVAKDERYVPHMEIVDGVTTAYIDFDITLRSDKETLLQIDSNVQLQVNVYIVKGFKLTVDVKMLKIKVKDILVNNIDPEIDDRDISSFIGFASGFIRNYVNQFIKNFEIPLPISDKIDLKDVQLEEKDFYIYADITPKFNVFTPVTE